MANLFVCLALGILVATAVFYIARKKILAKKNGTPGCIGCSECKSCSGCCPTEHHTEKK